MIVIFVIILYLLLLLLDRIHSVVLTTPISKYKIICQWIISNNNNNDITSFLHENANELFPTSTACKKVIRKGLVLINNIKANNDNNKIINIGETYCNIII